MTVSGFAVVTAPASWSRCSPRQNLAVLRIFYFRFMRLRRRFMGAGIYFPVHPKQNLGSRAIVILTFQELNRATSLTKARMPMLDIPHAPTAVELTAKQMLTLFPTPMFTGMLSDLSLCDRIDMDWIYSDDDRRTTKPGLIKILPWRTARL